MRTAVLPLFLLIALACARPCADTEAFQRRIESVAAERDAFMERLGEGLPPEGRAAIANLFDEEFERLAAAETRGDQIWFWREEKCPGCGWYRDGYAAIRDCRVTYRFTASDEM